MRPSSSQPGVSGRSRGVLRLLRFEASWASLPQSRQCGSPSYPCTRSCSDSSRRSSDSDRHCASCVRRLYSRPPGEPHLRADPAPRARVPAGGSGSRSRRPAHRYVWTSRRAGDVPRFAEPPRGPRPEASLGLGWLCLWSRRPDQPSGYDRPWDDRPRPGRPPVEPVGKARRAEGIGLRHGDGDRVRHALPALLSDLDTRCVFSISGPWIAAIRARLPRHVGICLAFHQGLLAPGWLLRSCRRTCTRIAPWPDRRPYGSGWGRYLHTHSS